MKTPKTCGYLLRNLALAYLCLAFAILQLPLAAHAAESAPVTIAVKADQPVHAISPTLYGIFLEDINFGADGGLNAELVKNGGFEFPQNLMGWHEVKGDNARGTLSTLREAPLRVANPTYVQIASASDGSPFGMANEGFRGIGVRGGEAYHFTCWARTEPLREVTVKVRLVDAKQHPVAQGEFTVTGTEWHPVTLNLSPQTTCQKASLQLVLTQPGRVDVDLVSLFPEETWKKRPQGWRKDMVQLLADLKPGFFRFPGGCIVEGTQLQNRYQWKTTLGERADRRLLFNRWNTEFKHRLTPDYFQSFAMGFYEYFLMSEDLGAEPLPILNCGMACQFNSAELVPLEELGPYIQDALDLIEFANGPVTSTWGAKRAEFGHPEPFNLKFLGIGNEQWGPQYIERYQRFAEVLKEQHPEIKLVSGAGPSPADQNYNYAWPELRALGADIVDEHCYAMPDWFLKSANRYDGFERNGPKVFMGEYAAQSNDICSPDNRNNLRCALAEAAFMTGLERNSDVVVMSSYAPLFGHEEAWQWRPNLIWFDNLQSYGTPNYYVQQLFSTNRGDETLPLKIVDSRPTESPGGKVGVATTRSSAEFREFRVAQNNETLFRNNELIDLSDVEMFHGNWSLKDRVLSQQNAEGDGRVFFGDSNWTDYTFTLQARKLGGSDGFVILLRKSAGGSYLAWHVGGWGNRSHGVFAHQACHNANAELVAQVDGSIEANRWYDVKVVLKGTQVKCYLDGTLIHDLDIPGPQLARVYGTASREKSTGDTILKIVNAGDSAASSALHLEGLGKGPHRAKVTTLTGSPDDINSLEEPNKIQPVTSELSSFSTDQNYVFPSHSLTVLRIH